MPGRAAFTNSDRITRHSEKGGVRPRRIPPLYGSPTIRSELPVNATPLDRIFRKP
jgi:hypothetical protein